MLSDTILDKYLDNYQGKFADLIVICERFLRIAILKDNKTSSNYLSIVLDAVHNTDHKNKDEIEAIEKLCIAVSMYFNSNYVYALSLSEKAMYTLRNSELKNFYNVLAITSGLAYRGLGKLDKAVQLFLNSYQLNEVSENLFEYNIVCSYQLAEIHLSIKDLYQAEKFYQLTLELSKKSNTTLTHFRANVGIANLYLHKDEYDLCKKHLDIAYTLEGIGNGALGRVLCDYGLFYYKTKDYNKAIKYLKESLSIRLEYSLIDAASTNYMNLTKIYLALNQYDEALQNIEKAYEICMEHRSETKIMQCYYLLAQTHKRIENFSKAVQYFDLYINLYQSNHKKQLENIYFIKNSNIN
ncbi:MAG: tetratricopeptide repeat protein [Flavobacteriales bacterium]|jgi:tetratricopeptide (TPR) repeat protein|nr:tetratricopeptide repeat protein [Flavobacteriales bacterium]